MKFSDIFEYLEIFDMLFNGLSEYDFQSSADKFVFCQVSVKILGGL